jgi:hypothetical protein
MGLSRRTLLERLALLRLAPLVALPGQACAAEPKKWLNLADYGGGKGDPAVDTAAVRRCIADAARQNLPWIVPKGTWALSPDASVSAKPFSYHGSQTAFRIYPCIELSAPTHCIGMGGRFVITAGPSFKNPPPEKDARVVMFATRRRIGAPGEQIAHVIFEGVTFDFDQRFSQVQNPYGFELNGVDDVRFLKCAFVNSALAKTQARRGWGLSLVNCRDVKINGNRFENLTQGLNARYLSQVELNDNAALWVQELFDFDGVVDGLVSRRCTFTGVPGKGVQMYDLSAARNVQISDVTCVNVDQVAAIYDKSTTPPTYARYQLNPPPTGTPDYITSDNVVIERVNASNTAQSLPFLIGITRLPIQRRGQNTSGRPSPKRVILRDITLKNSGAIRITEGQVTLQNIVMENVTRIDPKRDMAAISAIKQRLSPQIAKDAILDLTLDNVRITGAHGPAIRVEGAEHLAVRNLYADGVEAAKGRWVEIPPGSKYSLPAPANAAGG